MHHALQNLLQEVCLYTYVYIMHLTLKYNGGLDEALVGPGHEWVITSHKIFQEWLQIPAQISIKFHPWQIISHWPWISKLNRFLLKRIVTHWCIYPPVVRVITVRWQAFIWHNGAVSSDVPYGMNFSEIWLRHSNYKRRKCIGKCQQNLDGFVSASMC